ncbi:MAG: hypothetical protein AMJ53_15485 [Gammaproteobacteria bacterium SG8_11]|nr:MAG: hypothetical protein AMJ53_15485 [Gammaproteobacteria bacterium SG8_11]
MQEQAATQQVQDSDWQIWTRFADANNVEEFCQSWLAIQCRQIGGIAGGLVLLGPAGKGPFKPVAVWPDMRNDMRHLSKAAEQALSERRGLLLKNSSDGESSDANTRFHIAYPLELNEQLYGVIVLDVTSRPEAQLQAVLRQLHWGSAWLEILLRRKEAEKDDQTLARLVSVLDTMAGLVDQSGFHTSAMSFVTELATHFNCNRVSIGFIKRGRMVVNTMSHNAQFNEKSNLARAIGSAMDESFDQKDIIVYPAPEGEDIPLVTRAHEELIKQSGSGTVCSIPIVSGENIVGTLTLERNADNPFDEETVETLEGVASLAGPVLVEKRANDRWLLFKIGDSIYNQLQKLIGPRHVAYKLNTVLLLAIVLLFTFAKGDFRVSADTVIEGEIQRVVTAPFAAYVAESEIRAGDVVNQGQVLAILDDRDLKLEQIKLLGQKQQLASQYREAMANHDRAQVRITMAKSAQIQAQLDLIEYKLARTKLVAPFEGVVVSGDLSQALGAPVEKGQVLFEVAPLDAYRIILQVDERDVTYLKEEQLGTLILSSLPDEELFFTVKSITPVSTAKEGKNYFRVEAQLDDLSQNLRPGMEGVGKVKIGRENLFWIWTYKIINWFRLWVWSWLP